MEEWKIVQYADDLTAFLNDLASAQNLFKLLVMIVLENYQV